MTVLSQLGVLRQQISLRHGIISIKSRVHISHGIAWLDITAKDDRCYDKRDPSDSLHSAEESNADIGCEASDQETSAQQCRTPS